MVDHAQMRALEGIPSELNENFIMHIRAFRDAACPMLKTYRAQMEQSSSHIERKIKREEKLAKSCIVNLDTESVPADFTDMLARAIIKDHTQRTRHFSKQRVPNNVGKLAIDVTFLRPIDAAKNQQPTDSPIMKLLAEASSRLVKVNYETREHNLAIVKQVVAGFDFVESTIPVVRQRVADTLNLMVR